MENTMRGTPSRRSPSPSTTATVPSTSPRRRRPSFSSSSPAIARVTSLTCSALTLLALAASTPSPSAAQAQDTPQPQANGTGASSQASSLDNQLTSTVLAQQTEPQGECAGAKIVVGGCDPSNQTYCDMHCNNHNSTYLSEKELCCKYAGINANLLAFEESETWIPRIEEFGKCTGANVRLQYLPEGEDGMGDALKQDVGENEDESTGQGIYDAYIVQAPWLPPVFKGLKSLSQYIKENDEYIQFMDINQASRSAVSFEGEVRALPLDTDYIALGWRQDVFDNPKIRQDYYSTWGDELKVPDTIEELVEVSERLSGRHDFNGDGEMDWGFCLTPQTNYFQAFLAPILQTNLRECEDDGKGGFRCMGANTGQNMFFDVDNFEPLIFNPGYRKAVELYWRFVRASNCQHQTKIGVKCDRKSAFPTGRCAGVISMPGTMTNLLREDGKYAPKPENRIDDEEFYSNHAYWGRRKVFPGSEYVVNWSKPGLPLEKCTPDLCPQARGGINYAPFFAEGGESYALNGRQSKPKATEVMWDMFTWLSTLPVGEVPLAGTYRKSQLKPESIEWLANHWQNEVMALDLQDVLNEYFKSEEEGGNVVQDLFIIGFSEYNDALDIELHDNLILKDMNAGGLFNFEDPPRGLDVSSDEFDERYHRFVKALAQRYDDVHALQDGGALHQLELWRGALDISPTKSKDEICQDLLATDHAGFDKLGCINVVTLKDLCQSQKSDVEEYAKDTCKEDSNQSTIIIIVLCSIVGVALLGGLAYYTYKRYMTYIRIRKAHEQLMEATLNESVRALHQLDYPLHLVRGDEFVAEGKLMRHEVLRNTHKLTVLDSLADVDAFIAAGKHVLFFSHQWTSFTGPDPSNHQYRAMCDAAVELAKRNGWDQSLKDVFVWVDYSCIPQANPSTQNLAIRSLAAYASSATYFVIVAPDTPHADLDDTCDLGTYQRRMWCRAEQVCHSMRNGTEGMYLSVGAESPLAPVRSDFFRESLHVFNGDLTCCRLEHKGMGACDRQSLVIPLLGLYGELFRASHEAKGGGKVQNPDALQSVDAFLGEIEKHQEDVFPRTFQRVIWRKNKRVVEEVLLFGDLIDRMKARISSGAGFAIDEENTGTLSTKASASDFVRHGASDFLRHGVVHGSGVSGSGSKAGVQIETAVGTLADIVE